MTFMTANISLNNVSHEGKRVTKISTNGYNEGVYMNAFIVCQPTFSLKIIKQPTNPDGICIGVAVDSSHYTEYVAEKSWSFRNGGYNFDHNAGYSPTPYSTKVNDTVNFLVVCTLSRCVWEST